MESSNDLWERSTKLLASALELVIKGSRSVQEWADCLQSFVFDPRFNYEFEINFDDPQWKTIDRGRYAFVGDVTVDDYPITETGIKKVRFRELAFDHDPTDQEVLDLAEQLNCRQPNRAEAETVIRKKYTSEELGRNPRIGLIGPAVRRGGKLDRAYVNGYEGGVSLYWHWTENRWRRSCRFVVVCK